MIFSEQTHLWVEVGLPRRGDRFADNPRTARRSARPTSSKVDARDRFGVQHRERCIGTRLDATGTVSRHALDLRILRCPQLIRRLYVVAVDHHFGRPVGMHNMANRAAEKFARNLIIGAKIIVGRGKIKILRSKRFTPRINHELRLSHFQ